MERTTQPRRYRLASDASLTYRHWGDEAVLFDDATGATHRLASAPLALLEALRTAGRPLTFAGLVESAFPAISPIADDERAHIDETLEALERAGLIAISRN